MRLIGLLHCSTNHMLAVDQRSVAIENDQFQCFVSACCCFGPSFMAFWRALEWSRLRTKLWPARHAMQPSCQDRWCSYECSFKTFLRLGRLKSSQEEPRLGSSRLGA